MTSSPPSPGPAPSAIGSGLLILGDRWNLLILQQAFLNHTRRFADWRRTLGVSDSVLAGRISELVAAELLRPTPYRTDGRSRTEYRLTEKGLQLWTFLVAIGSWERSWVPDGTVGEALLHSPCGRLDAAELGCGSCGVAPITARDTTASSGPDTTFGNVAVPRHHRRTARDREHPMPDAYRPETLEILGDRWSTVILVAAFLRVRRFAEFQRELGVAPGVLSERLRRFIDLGVLRPSPPTAEYRLTAKGLAFFPVLAFLVEWSQDWYAHPGGGGLVITHTACGRPLRPYLRCAGCRRPMTRREVRFTASNDQVENLGAVGNSARPSASIAPSAQASSPETSTP